MTKAKLRESGWAQSKLRGVLGSQNRSSGELRVDLLSVWRESGQVLGCPGGSGGAPEKFRGRIWAKNIYENLSKKSFPSGSAETGAEDIFHNCLRYFFPARPAGPGLSAAACHWTWKPWIIIGILSSFEKEFVGFFFRSGDVCAASQ